MSKAFRTLGRRMSPSISSTRWPSWASEMARLMETVVFPSLGCELLTSKVRGGRSAVESRTEVRKLRNASASADCWVASTSIRYHRGVVDGRAEVCGFPLASGLLPPYRRYAPFRRPLSDSTAGISASAGRPRNRSTSSEVFKLLSTCSCRKAAPTPRPVPKSTARTRLSGRFGRAGFFGASAASTIRMLLAFRPAETPASLSLCSRPS